MSYVKEATPSKNGKASTGAQTEISYDGGVMNHHSTSQAVGGKKLDYKKYRQMRRNPTIGLARDITTAPGVISSWQTVVDDGFDPQLSGFVERHLFPLRDAFITSCLYGEVDFGWRAFEVVYNAVDDVVFGKSVVPIVLRPLKNDNTWARFDEWGRFDGLVHQDVNTSNFLGINSSHSVFVNFDTEGLGDYGDPLMMRAELPYDLWLSTNKAAEAYDKKIAGVVWDIRYPKGSSHYKGQYLENSKIPELLFRDLEAGGYLAMPNYTAKRVEQEFEELGQGEWKISILEAAGKGGDFDTRFAYLDKLMARGIGVLERAFMEGNYGTKAEAAEHANVMLLLSALSLRIATNAFNESVLKPMLTLNFGHADGVRIHDQHIGEANSDFLRTLLTGLLASPSAGFEVADSIDIPKLMESLRVPADAREISINNDTMLRVAPIDGTVPDPEEIDDDAVAV